jgi:hypothetical protein
MCFQSLKTNMGCSKQRLRDCEDKMKNSNNTLSTLKHELEFLERGGYRTPIGSRQPLFCMETSVEWRQPLFFEDSPSCPKKRYCACDPEGDCVLMSFVPAEHRHESVPCHHIPLNEKGQTINTLVRNSTNKEAEDTLRTWLVKTIKPLEEPIGTSRPSF